MKEIATFLTIIVFSASLSGCLSEDDGDDSESHIIDWEEYSLDEGGIFNTHPLHFSMDMEFLPDSNIVLISEWPQNEIDPPAISTWRFDEGVIERIGQISLVERGDVIYSGGAQCGVKLAVPPDDSQSLLVFRCMSNTSVTIERYDLLSNGILIPGTREILVTYDTGNIWGSYEHLVGEIEFGSEGFLWVFMGYGNMDNTSQDPMSPFGSVLRMGLGPSGLFPAPENPASKDEGWHPMVYSKGLRMPWTAAQDEAGFWWVGEVGENQMERILVIEEGGQNFGYFKHVWLSQEDENCTSCEKFSTAVATYTRESNHTFMLDDVEGHESFYAAVWVGVQLPVSPNVPEEYSGRILFGDFTRGFVRSLVNNESGDSEHLGHLVGVVDIEVYGGEVFALTTGVQVYQEVRKPGFWRLSFN